MKANRSQKDRSAIVKSARRILQGSVLSLVAAWSPAAALAQSVWVGTDGTWSTSFNWASATLPVSGPTTELRFEASGGAGYTTTNDIGGGTFSLNRITVSNTGTGTVTIAGAASGNTFSFSGANPTLDITGTVLFTGLLVGTPTLTKTGAGTFIHDSNNGGFTGTLIIDQGTFINRAGPTQIPTGTPETSTNFNPVSIVVNDGATYQFGFNTVNNPNLPNSTYITVNSGGTVNWQEGEDFGGFHLHGGTINLQRGNATSNGTTPQSWSSGTVTGARFNFAGSSPINKTTAGTVFLAGGVALNSAGGLNILEGTVSMATAVNLGTANVTLGDTVGVTAGTFEYMGPTGGGLGGFTVNEGNGVIRVATPSTILTLAGAISGSGDISKTGPGKLRLTGSLGSTGKTTVAEGPLQVEPGVAFGHFAVIAGGILAVNAGAGAAAFVAPSIELLGGGASLQFDLDTTVPTTTPLVAVMNPNGLTFSGNPTLRVTTKQAPANGTYVLIDYNGDGTPITEGFNLALPGRTTGSLIYDVLNTQINMEVTGTDTVKWTGTVNGDWNVGTAAGVGGTNNWQLVAAGTPTNYIDTDSITFDDTATTYVLNLTTTVNPASLNVSASSNYTFGGPGKIAGETSLAKSGTGTLILAGDHEYRGGTAVTGGTLQLGNGGTTGSVPNAITLNGGGLAFHRSDDLTFSNAIAIAGNAAFLQHGANIVTIPNALAAGTNDVLFGGAGNLVLGATLGGTGVVTKEGTGTLTLLANNNSFTGTLNINGGTVLLEDFGAGGDLGASSIVINNGGTFIFGPTGNTDMPDTNKITVNAGGLFRIEQGENYGGVVLNGGELRFVSSGRTGVNSTAMALNPGDMVYDLRSGTITTDFTAGSGGVLNQGDGGVLVKSTAGTVSLSGAVTFQNALPIQIKEGTLAMGVSNVPAGGSAPVTLGDVTTNGTFQLDGTGSAFTPRQFTVEAGGGTFRVADAAGTLNITSTISGAGGLAKTGAGSLVLNGGNDYMGGTIVTGGTLEANNFFGSATGTGMVAIASTLRGNGGIIAGEGNSIFINGVFEPGSTGALFGEDFVLQAGTGGSVVFDSASVARFDLWSTTGADQSMFLEAADRLVVGGSLSIGAGATLKLGNPNGLTFQEGDVFQIFDWTTAIGVTGTWSIDVSELNLGELTLDAAELYTSGKVTLVVPEPASASLLLLGVGACLARRGGRRCRNVS